MGSRLGKKRLGRGSRRGTWQREEEEMVAEVNGGIYEVKKGQEKDKAGQRREISDLKWMYGERVVTICKQ